MSFPCVRTSRENFGGALPSVQKEFFMINSLENEGGAPDLKKAPRRNRRSDTADPGKVDRLPPHSIEAEQGVLGCILLSPHECMGETIEKFKQGAELFYDLRHRVIYEVLAEMYDKKEGIDLITFG